MVFIPSWPRITFGTPEKRENLDSALRILQELGNPHRKLPPTIHIAGTNGKGSTLAMLRSIFQQAGYSVHSFSSPHFLDFNERINLAGKDISDHHLESILRETKQAYDRLGVEAGFFEGTTMAAFLAFSRQPADILLLETGLGGRLDFTNVIENPILTIITPISYDHMEYLGDSLDKIASEKAGIIKQNAPCVISLQTEEVYDILLQKCEEMRAPSLCYEYDYVTEKSPNGFNFKSQMANLALPELAMLGDHQIINAGGAIAAMIAINQQFKITTEQIKQGLVNAKWPGRLQRIEPKYSNKFVDENIAIYIDGAHNEGGAIVLGNWARENLTEPVYMILGMTNNRDVAKFCQHFKDVCLQAVAVRVTSEPSSYSGDFLSEQVKKAGLNCVAQESVQSALEYINEHSQGKKANILITGSLFLISDFLNLF